MLPPTTDMFEVLDMLHTIFALSLEVGRQKFLLEN